MACGAGPRPGSSRSLNLKGWPCHLLSKLTAASSSTATTGTSKGPQKDSQNPRGTHQNPTWSKGPQQKGDWQRGMLAIKIQKQKQAHHSFSLSSLDLELFFCPLDLMDHSVFTANLAEQGRVWQCKGTQPWDGGGVGLVAPSFLNPKYEQPEMSWNDGDCFKKLESRIR